MIKRAYRAHRYNAKQRNTSFLLSFEEWLSVWKASGHLHERGCRRGQYVMARHKDRGPYAIGNVKIIRHSVNVTEGQLGKSKPSLIGNTHTLGLKHSIETRLMMSASGKVAWEKRRSL